MMTLKTRTAELTGEVASALAQTLVRGDLLLLYGDLGAGKTAFVRGLAQGLGADGREVSSPTFSILQVYKGGRLPLYHFDLYRLTGEQDVWDNGFDEMLVGGDGVCAVEWPQVAGAFFEPLRAKRIDLIAGEGEHTLRLEGTDDLPELGRLLQIGVVRVDGGGQDAL